MVVRPLDYNVVIPSAGCMSGARDGRAAVGVAGVGLAREGVALR